MSQKRESTLNQKVAEMVALDLQPYSFVEDCGFKALMSEAVPGYHLPSRTTLSRVLIPRLFDNTRAKVRAELRKAFEDGTTTLAFTSDIWTSRANESFISLMCHFLTVRFEMKRFTLNTRHMPESHTALNIAASLEQLCAEWEIPTDCVKYVVTDNGRNIRAAARTLPWRQRACFAHTLQLAISDAKSTTPAINKLCKKARGIVGHYKHSPVAQKRLHDVQRQLNKNVLHIVQDVETRWNSEYLMFSRLLELKEAITLELATSDTHMDGFNSSEWRDVAEYVEALKPLFDATVISSVEKYPSLSCQIPIIFGMLHCLKGCRGNTEFASNLAKSIKTRFASYEFDEVASLAMFLDPRFKATVHQASDQMIWLKDLVSRQLQSADMEHGTDTAVPATTSRPLVASSVWNAFDHLVMNKEKTQTESAPEREIMEYAEQPLLDRGNDPCEWWRSIGHLKYPYMSTLAQKYLAIPATSVPSERAFSTGGNVVTPHRERLLSEHVEQLIFLHDNL